MKNSLKLLFHVTSSLQKHFIFHLKLDATRKRKSEKLQNFRTLRLNIQITSQNVMIKMCSIFFSYFSLFFPRRAKKIVLTHFAASIQKSNKKNTMENIETFSSQAKRIYFKKIPRTELKFSTLLEEISQISFKRIMIPCTTFVKSIIITVTPNFCSQLFLEAVLIFQRKSKRKLVGYVKRQTENSARQHF